MAKVLVLGAGMMGSALAVPLADRDHDVRLVGTHLDAEIIESLRRDGTHPKLGLALPESIRPFYDSELDVAADGVELIALGVSSAGVRWAAGRIAPLVRPGLPVVMISKGLEWNGSELRTLPDVLAAELADVIAPAAIAGPCIAGELARRAPTLVVVTGRDPDALGRIAQLLAAPYYHVRTSADVVGVECCAALKNAYAMGIGLCVGLHEQRGGQPGGIALHNLESAVFAQSIRELQRVIELAGGDPHSALGLAGVGDLDVTCNGGRTGRFGRLLGLGMGRDRAIESMHGATLECLDILRVMRDAMRGYAAQGRLRAGELPLLALLAAVALDDAPVHVPLAEFFR